MIEQHRPPVAHPEHVLEDNSSDEGVEAVADDAIDTPEREEPLRGSGDN